MGSRRTLRFFTVDAFSSEPFSGNPAAVCLDDTGQCPDHGLKESEMQNIAREMNISETAYIWPKEIGNSFKTGALFGLRWFTPTNEVPLCGHATLASAAALMFGSGNQNQSLRFDTLSGQLEAFRNDDGYIGLVLPNNTPEPHTCDQLTDLLQCVVDKAYIKEVQFSSTTKKLLIRLSDSCSREFLETLQPDIAHFTTAHSGMIKGVIVTVKADKTEKNRTKRNYDFFSRYFAPWNGISEDPVTGSAHTVLGPYWSKVLNKTDLHCRQCSSRGGDLKVVVKEESVEISGPAVIVIDGYINV